MSEPHFAPLRASLNQPYFLPMRESRKMAKTKVPVEMGRCIQVSPSLASGVILYKLMRLISFTKVERDGSAWVTMSQQDWLDETGMTINLFKKGMVELEKEILIVRERHLFLKKTVTYVRPTDKAFELIMYKSAKECRLDAQPTGQMYIKPTSEMHVQPTGQLHGVANQNNPVNKPSKNPVLASCSLADGPSAPDPKIIKLFPEEEMKKGSSAKGAKNYLANMPKVKIGFLQPDKTESMVITWRQGLEERGMENLDVTNKMWGQFKYLMKIFPKDQGPVILEKILKNWLYFTDEAERKYGALKSPQVPVLGYILKYASAAMTMDVEETTKPKPAQSIGPKPTTYNGKPKAPPATLEEIYAILNDEDVA